MASCVNLTVTANPRQFPSPSSSSSKPRGPFLSLKLSSTRGNLALSLRRSETQLRTGVAKSLSPSTTTSIKSVALANTEPLKIMISGAPASGKGTQCELITEKYGLVHIAAGDLLRAEIAAGSENGKQAKEYMERGQLVPDEIVVTMVKERLLRQDSLNRGWLLDGYPRSASQAAALKDFGLEPDLFILLDVPEEILIERVVGRRLDPVTGKIYHLKYSPPETEEISARLTQRFDDTEEKVKLRLLTHNKNVEAVLSMYKDITLKVKGDASKEEVFAQIDAALTEFIEQKTVTSDSLSSRIGQKDRNPNSIESIRSSPQMDGYAHLVALFESFVSKEEGGADELKKL